MLLLQRKEPPTLCTSVVRVSIFSLAMSNLAWSAAITCMMAQSGKNVTFGTRRHRRIHYLAPVGRRLSSLFIVKGTNANMFIPCSIAPTFSGEPSPLSKRRSSSISPAVPMMTTHSSAKDYPTTLGISMVIYTKNRHIP